MRLKPRRRGALPGKFMIFQATRKQQTVKMSRKYSIRGFLLFLPNLIRNSSFSLLKNSQEKIIKSLFSRRIPHFSSKQMIRLLKMILKRRSLPWHKLWALRTQSCRKSKNYRSNSKGSAPKATRKASMNGTPQVRKTIMTMVLIHISTMTIKICVLKTLNGSVNL